MKTLVKKFALAAAALLALLAFSPGLSSALDTKGAIQCGVNGANGADCSAQPPQTSSLDSTIKTIINLLSVIVGIAAVIMIIIAGLRYVTSGGKQESVTSAKNTLLYALIGLVIVALAQTIAHFTLTEAKNPSSSSLNNPAAVHQNWS